MHQIILITAMTATTGLFGGGKHCGKPQHGKKAVSASSCYSASPCGGASYAASPCGGSAPAPAPYAAPSTQSYAPAPYAAPSTQSYAPAPQAAPMAPAKMDPAGVPPAPPAPTPSSAFAAPGGSVPVVSTGGVR